MDKMLAMYTLGNEHRGYLARLRNYDDTVGVAIVGAVMGFMGVKVLAVVMPALYAKSAGSMLALIMWVQ